MSYIIVKIQVEDLKTFREVYNSAIPIRAAAGCTNDECVLHNSIEPNSLTILQEWENPEHASKFFSREDIREKMKTAGVLGPPAIQHFELVS